MENFLFYLFSILTVMSALLVVVNRDAVNGAMFMILSLVGMAALFLLLEAYFIAILQILVYAGAVMVLFLFIIMLIDVEKTSKRMPDRITLVASLVGFGLLVFGCMYLFIDGDAQPLEAVKPLPEGATTDNVPFATASRSLGYLLFTKYMLPFQVTGFLLLIAMIGVIVVSKKISASGDAESERPKRA
ncbi:NADH-quinone oxidoreductase subunit J [Rubellicoccus peritrichatus]|uniref:NADH-quinone oxidoreductase subunit J n=2 Tax=Rubellicoccus peritrichatus TaxID=3080537 RepID=A0AAQ3LCL0_9BACT|nr:NADH-quinone oxidoreductase subunit J [Puniceicoccus sp. CR14]WOO39484.1 NADH-quinone oxidoreductase subunit J [Puniceicoccus sp. CR14]